MTGFPRVDFPSGAEDPSAAVRSRAGRRTAARCPYPGHAVSGGSSRRRVGAARGHSQEGFALASGVDRSYVGGLERGDRNPALSMIIRLAEALGVPPRALFEEDPADGRLSDNSPSEDAGPP